MHQLANHYYAVFACRWHIALQIYASLTILGASWLRGLTYTKKNQAAQDLPPCGSIVATTVGLVPKCTLGLSLICHYFYRFCFLAMLENFTYFAQNYASIYLFCPKLCQYTYNYTYFENVLNMNKNRSNDHCTVTRDVSI